MRSGDLIILLVFHCCTMPALYAQFASPGKLSDAHKKLEGVGNCSKCHNFGEKSFRQNCLSCHTEIRSRIADAHGYHYYTRKLECSTCHKEHHGRAFKLIRWTPASFDHKQTGFQLTGKHDGLGCRKCHNPSNIHAADIKRKPNTVQEETYLGLSAACSNCHEDEHRGQFTECGACHTPESWKQHRFSHDKARFPLKGKHAGVSCASCHPEKDDGKHRFGDTKFRQFKGIQHSECADCHTDAHNGSFGTDCRKCHSTSGWRQVSISSGTFDHATTRFPLVGRHATVRCAQCHAGGDFLKFKDVDLSHCAYCHQDYHKGELAHRSDKGACEQCHTTEGFSPAFFDAEQHRSTRFPLRGAHESIPCIRCHLKETAAEGKQHRFTWATLECGVCHSDPHVGQLDGWISQNGCTGCHSEESWYVTQFDHTKTRFPLTGSHREVLCARCHGKELVNGTETIRFRFPERACTVCHEDRHAGQFASEEGRTDCARCHTTGTWAEVTFDHATMSRFPLTGKHTEVPCVRCHQKADSTSTSGIIRFKPLDTSCSSCHSTGQ